MKTPRAFVFSLLAFMASALSASAAVVTATYTSATDVPVTAASYTATGNSVNFTLSYAPVTGTTLTVLNNTGLGFISGTFSNLTQGQTVSLTFNGGTYNFVANYFGGTGNDLVLVWKNNRPLAWGLNTNGQLGNNSTTQSNVPVAVTSSGVLSGKTVLAISAGGSHSLALCSDGTVATWGLNTNGQLGSNSTTQSNVPVAVTSSGVLAGKTVVAVSAGYSHNLALCSDGTVATWGLNTNGQLGNNSTTQSNVPVAVTSSGVLAGKTVVAVSAGYSHNLALCSDGTLAAWGYNSNGGLGNNSTTDSSVPVAVVTSGVLSGKTVVAIAAGAIHSVALCSDGTVATWGYNPQGQLGNNSTTDSKVPVTVTATGALSGKTVIAISSGGHHSFALCADGTLVAWGYNGYGQLGNNSTTDSKVPVAITASGVLSGKTVVAVGGGYLHSMALCSDGTLAAWGENSNGQLGINSTTPSSVPVAVTAGALAVGERFTQASGGTAGYHTMALVAAPPLAPTVTTPTSASLTASTAILGGSVTSVGDGTITERGVVYAATATNSDPVIGGTGVTKVTATGTTGVFTTSVTGLTAATAYSFKAYATNGAGVTGYTSVGTFFTTMGNLNATYTSATDVPTNVPVGQPVSIPVGSTATFALGYAPVTGTTLTVVKNTSLGFISGTFSNLAQGQAVALTYNGTTYNFVANYFGGTGNDLVLVWAGTRAMAWGNNGVGQLGDSTTTNKLTPVNVLASGVLAGKTVVTVSTGSGHSLALCSDGTLATWGRNTDGQLGNNSTTNSSAPVAVTTTGTALAGKTVIAIAAGGYHNLALCSDGTLAAWGYNGSGMLGNGSNTNSLVPVAVTTAGTPLAGKTIVSIAAGTYFSLVLCSDGTLAAWGNNTNNELGNSSFPSGINVPVAVTTVGTALAGKTVTGIAAEMYHSFALCSDGTIAAWGSNSYGQLGNNSTTSSSVAVAVSTAGTPLAGKTVVALAGGGEGHSLALCSDGTLAAWGSNASGQLGNNSTTNSSVPVAVTTSGVLAGKTVVAIAAGYQWSSALCSDGTLANWGYNNVGQLGNNSTTSSSVPVVVSSTSLAANERFVFSGGGAYSHHRVALVAPAFAAITSPTSAAITSTSAVLGGNVTSDGGSAVTERGIVYAATATNSNPSIGGTGVTKVTASGTTGVFTVSVTGLSPATGYSFKAYVINSLGTSYTNVDTFATQTQIFNVNATYTAATDVAVTSANPALNGGTVTLALGFVPSAGTNLTVVNNTGRDFISGTFSNLAQGQAVALTYNGATYNFVANYFGGTGNDLVLVWAGTRVMQWPINGVLVPSNLPASGVLAGKTVVTVSAGTNHSLALCSDGTLATWGTNTDGQLGNNSTTSSSVPVAVTTAGTVLAGKTVIAIATGNSRNLVLCSDGTLAAWGWNISGQLGNGSTTTSLVPVAVTKTGTPLAGKTIIAIAAGASHCMALCLDGTLVAWGYNGSGLLGNGSTTDSLVPTAVTTVGTALADKTVTGIACGGNHSLALCSDGTVAAWGNNSRASLGINSTTGIYSVPVAVSTASTPLAGKTVVAISAGHEHNLALCSDGTLVAWGFNSQGQLGNGSTTLGLVPVAVTTSGVLAGKTVVAIAAAYQSSFALCSDGMLAAWGSNSSGQLGDNTTTQRNAPVAVSTTPLAANERFVGAGASMALVAPAYIPTVASISPTRGSIAGGTSVTITGGNLTGATSVTIGGAAATNVTIVNATTITCTTPAGAVGTASVVVTSPYGSNPANTLYTYFDPIVTATYTSAADVPVTTDSSYIATGRTVNFTLGYAPVPGTTLTVVKNTGLGFINGAFSNIAQGQAVTLSYNLVTYKFVANYYGGTGNDLVLVWAGTRAMGWGYNGYAQLGDNSSTNRLVPVNVLASGVLAGKTITAATAGSYHSLVVSLDGTVAAWGYNAQGQLGNNSNTQSFVPVLVNTSGVLSGKTVIAVASGYYHSLALCSDGTLASWGFNTDSQLGNNSTTQSNVPVAVTTSGVLSGKTVTAIASGYYHNLVLCSDGTLASWGYNGWGQLGNNSTTTSSVPVTVVQTGVLAGKTVTAIAAGGSHSVALCSDGTLALWGSGSSGQLGNNSTAQSNVPVAVNTSGALSGKTIIAVAAGDSHTAALCSDGTLVTWGYNSNGQLGNNSTTQSTVPVLVNTSGVLSGKTVTAIAAGASHSLARCSDGTLASWGYNGNGQIGDNTTTNRLVPVAVSTASLSVGEGFANMATGSSANHSLAMVAPAPSAPLAVTSPTSTTITGTGATLGGNVTSDGGSTITERGVVYAVTSTNSNPQIGGTGVTKVTKTGTTGVFTVSVTGLSLGTGYSFRAYVTNSSGTAYTSTATFTTLDVPGAPTIGTATPGTGSAIVAFTAPASNGGSPITSYTVTSSPGSFTATGTSSPITVTGLANATAYTFTVTATNALGTGPASAPSNSVTTNANPTISDVADQSTNEDIATSSIAFTIGDTETAAASLTVSATSSNTTLVPNASIALSGSGAARNLIVTPAAHQFGSTTITLTVTDGGGLTATDTFLLTVASVNDAPTFALPTTQPAGMVWTARETVRDDWSAIAMSADGNKLAAVVNPGRIYTSTDAGVTWTPRGSTQSWRGIASSADGTTLAANARTTAGLVSAIYISRDSGATWTQRLSINAQYGFSIALSADGRRMAAAALYEGRIYTSSDYGVTWTPRESARGWSSIASSADGSKLVAGVSGGKIYTSSDYGVTWTARDSDRSWGPVASSADGSKLVAIARTASDTIQGSIYTSSNSGVTWTARATPGNWNSVSSSTDGNTLTACRSANGIGEVFRSTDAGVTWTQIVSPALYAYSPACSADGNKLVIIASNHQSNQVNQIYTSAPVMQNPGVVAGSGPATLAGFVSSISPGPANEASQTLSFTVTNSNNALFANQPAIAPDGTLTFTPSGSLSGSATVTVVAVDNGGTDNGGVDTSAPLTFTLNVDEAAPTDISLSPSNIVENNAANATVGTLTATDPNPGDTHTFTLVSGTGSTDNASFSIVGSTLKITPVASYATKSAYALRVRATDASGLFFEKALTVSVLPASGLPAFTSSVIRSDDLSSAKAMITGDFDRDGFADVAVAAGSNLNTFLSSENYSLSHPISLGGRPGWSLAAADLNLDGNLDLVVGYAGINDDSPGAGVLAFYGSSTGAFESLGRTLLTLPSPAGWLNGNFPTWLGAFDFSGDGRPDIVLRNYNNVGFRTYVGSYDQNNVPSFTSAGGISATFNSNGNVLATDDFDRNGFTDIAYTELVSGTSYLAILHQNDGNGSNYVGGYRQNTQFAVPGAVHSIATADFDGDGHLDVAMSSWVNNSETKIYFGKGTGNTGASAFVARNPITLTGMIDTNLSVTPEVRVSAADMNHDGKADIVVTDQSGRVRVLQGNGDMTFSISTSITLGTGAGRVSVVADFTRDGLPDVFAGYGLTAGVGGGGNVGAGEFLVNNTPALFPPPAFKFYAGASQSAPLGMSSVLESPTYGSIFTATSSQPWLSVTPSSGYTGWQPVIASVNQLAPANAADLAPNQYKGKLTFNAPGFAPGVTRVTMDVTGASGTLGSPVIMALPDSTYHKRAGDFNGDGRTDLVYHTTINNAKLAVVLLTNADGTWTRVASPSSGAGSDMAVGDFNGDGKLDLATLVGGGTVNLMCGDGLGGLGTAATTTASVGSAVYYGLGTHLAAGDFNNDGIDDVVLRGGSDLCTLLGTSAGFFRQASPASRLFYSNNPSTAYSSTRVPMVVGDFNGDGLLDVAAPSGSGGDTTELVIVAYANQMGGFYKGISFGYQSVLAGDFNQDGIADLLGDSYLHFGSQGAGLLPRTTIASPESIQTCADINGDGLLDLIGSLRFSLGNGDGTFQTAKSFPSGVYGNIMGDFTGDGVPDLISARSDDSNTITLSPGTKAATTATLATTGASSVYGQPVPVTVTVAPVNAATSFNLPTGSVSLIKAGSIVASSTRTSPGLWTFTPQGLGVGSHTVTAQYDGDSRHTLSTASSSVSFSITQATGSLAVSSSLNPANQSDPVTFTATLTPASGGGTVTFKDGTTTLGTAVLNAQGIAAFTPTTPLRSGSRAITAFFEGDDNVTSTTSPVLYQGVNQNPNAIVLTNLTHYYDGTPKAPTAVTVPANLQVNYTYLAGAYPGTTNLGSTPPTAVGTYTVVASIDDPFYEGTASSTFTINKGQATLAITNENRIYDGTPKPVTVTVVPAGLSYSLTYAGSATAPSALGRYPVVATITDPNYEGSATATLDISNAAVTTTTLVSSANPSAFFTSPTFTARATSTERAGLNGYMELLIDGVLLERKLVDADGYATFATTPAVLRGGPRSIRAVYNGDRAVEEFASSNITITQVVNKEPIAVTLSDLTQEYEGTGRAATATVTLPATHTSVQVDLTYDGSPALPVNVGTYEVVATINDPSLSGTASGTLTITKAPVGLSYGASLFAYDGQPHPFAVTPRPDIPLSIMYQALDPAGSVTSTAPVDAGRYQVTVTTSPNYELELPPTILTITKKGVTITLSGLSTMSDGTPKPVTVVTDPPGVNVAVTYTPEAGGTASSTPPSPPTGTAGRWKVQASVSDANLRGTAEATLNVRTRQTVVPTLTGPPASVPYYTSMFYLATVPSAPNMPPPTGQITFKQGTETVSVVTLNNQGTAGYSVGHLPVRAAPYSVTASYSGDQNYFPTESAAVETVITKATFNLSVDSPLTVPYDGTPKSVVFSTRGFQMERVDVEYGNTYTPTVPPTNASSYPVTATIADPNWKGSLTVTLKIEAPLGKITLDRTVVNFDGNPKHVTYTVDPPGGIVRVQYSKNNEAIEQPTLPGTYQVRASSVPISNIHYPEVEGELIIANSRAGIFFTNKEVAYNGMPQQIGVVTNPRIPVEVEYFVGEQSWTLPPFTAGRYLVKATTRATGYEGFSTDVFTIKPVITGKTVGYRSRVGLDLRDSLAVRPGSAGSFIIDYDNWDGSKTAVDNGQHVITYVPDVSADERYVFQRWSDGVTDNPRTEKLGAINPVAGTFNGDHTVHFPDEMTYTALAVKEGHPRIEIPPVTLNMAGLPPVSITPGTAPDLGWIEEGTMMRLGVTPMPGYIVDYWNYGDETYIQEVPKYEELAKIRIPKKGGSSFVLSIPNVNKPRSIVRKFDLQHKVATAKIVRGSQVTCQATTGGSAEISRDNQYSTPNQKGQIIWVPEGRKFIAEAKVQPGYIFQGWSFDGVEFNDPELNSYVPGDIRRMIARKQLRQEFKAKTSKASVSAIFVENIPHFDLSFGWQKDIEFDIKKIVKIKAAKLAQLVVKNTGPADAEEVEMSDLRVTAVQLQPKITAETPGRELLEKELTGAWLTYYLEPLDGEQNSSYFELAENKWIKRLYIDPHKPRAFPDPRDIDWSDPFNYPKLLWSFMTAWSSDQDLTMDDHEFGDIDTFDPGSTETVWKWPSVYLEVGSVKFEAIRYRVTATIWAENGESKNVSFWSY